jgi:hypothetical protein
LPFFRGFAGDWAKSQNKTTNYIIAEAWADVKPKLPDRGGGHGEAKLPDRGGACRSAVSDSFIDLVLTIVTISYNLYSWNYLKAVLAHSFFSALSIK